MAAMFRDFTFAPASPPAYSAYEADRALMNVSPTSKPVYHPCYPRRPPTPPCSIGDLVSKLNQQSLRIDTRVPHPSSSGPPTPPSDDDCAIQPTPQPTYSRISTSLLRMQRQSSSRMQCSSSCLRDISRLVRMIEAEEQCSVAELPSPSAASAASTCPSLVVDSDEGIGMDFHAPSQDIETLLGIPPRKASDCRESCARVARTVRMRKRSAHRVEKRRSL